MATKSPSQQQKHQKQHDSDKAKTYEQLYRSEKQRNDILKQKINMQDAQLKEVEDQTQLIEKLRDENDKYQQLVQKFEEQTQFKEEEFVRLKETIRQKFGQTEQEMVEAKRRLKEEQDSRYEDQTKFREEIERVGCKLREWEKDCEKLGQLKNDN